MTDHAKVAAFRWVDDNHHDWSSWNALIWDLGETAWREYRSAEWYVRKLSSEGFTVEEGSGGMPTAFSASWRNGQGPAVMTYAEYDAVPGNCQIADVYRAPRSGLSRFAGGHTDPHSALGIGALTGLLAAKAAMEKGGISGTLRFMGEPAEKVRGSKPIHAARNYYDGLDAILSFHPFYMLPLCNTARWNTHCGPFYCVLYQFLCEAPETWLAEVTSGAGKPIPAAHTEARAPGANDAAVAMYSLSKTMRDHMLPHTGAWSVNEVILASGQGTADNLPAQMSQIVYAIRASSTDMLNKVLAVLDRNAEAAATVAHCKVRKHWVSKSRPGLANHVMAEVVYRNLVSAGPPRWHGEAITCAQAIQKELGLEPMARPFLKETEELITPQEAERKLRLDLPAWQTHSTSDDYTDMSWHAPTARFYIGRASLAAPAGFTYPDWVLNALGGIPATIDPTIRTAAKTIAGAILDLMTDAQTLAAARAEFNQRTGGGVGGATWEKPWCDYPPPVDFPWPRYFETPTSREWWIPETADDRKLRRT
ncbi:MAG: amidohydrolase [Pseudomonadota bacterium]|nr:amidohydrolase [Pseudomonadota bacterium]